MLETMIDDIYPYPTVSLELRNTMTDNRAGIHVPRELLRLEATSVMLLLPSSISVCTQ